MKDKNIQELIDLFYAGKFTLVEKKVVKLIEKYPKNFVLYNLFGAILVNQKKLKQAVVNFKKSILHLSTYILYTTLGCYFPQQPTLFLIHKSFVL